MVETGREPVEKLKKEMNMTPKLNSGFDVHNTTIMEENETNRQTLGRKQPVTRKKRTNHFTEDLPTSANPQQRGQSIKKVKPGNGIRTKSSVGGLSDQQFG